MAHTQAPLRNPFLFTSAKVGETTPLDSNETANKIAKAQTTSGEEWDNETARQAGSALTLPEGAHLDPFDDDHGIEYWIWNGVRLVPACPDEVERIRVGEHLRVEQIRLENEARAQRGPRRPLARASATAARIWVYCSRWLGIPAALLPPEPHRQRKRSPEMNR